MKKLLEARDDTAGDMLAREKRAESAGNNSDVLLVLTPVFIIAGITVYSALDYFIKHPAECAAALQAVKAHFP